MKTLVIIPAYNEGDCMKEVVNRISMDNVDIAVVKEGSVSGIVGNVDMNLCYKKY